jgi:hypothetical protein
MIDSTLESRIAVMEAKFMALEKQLMDSNTLLCTQNQAILADLQTIKNQRIADDEKWRIIEMLYKSPWFFTIIGLAGLAVILILSRIETIQWLWSKL